MSKYLIYLCIFIWIIYPEPIFSFPYRWKKNDNFKLLAKRFSYFGENARIKITPKQIIKINRKKTITRGKIIEIPIQNRRLKVYFIRHGETLIQLSARSKVPIKTIKQWLGRLPLRATKKIYLPRVKRKKRKNNIFDKNIDDYEKKYTKSNATLKIKKEAKWKKLIKGNLSFVMEATKKEKLNFLSPLNLPIEKSYGIVEEILQTGVIYKIENTLSIHAAETGIIDFSKKIRGMGYTIIVAHPGGFHSLYSGIKKNYKSKGAVVLRGEALGETKEKNVTYALYYRGVPFDPEKYQNLIKEN